MFQNVLDSRSRPKLNEAAAWWAVGLVGAQIAVFGAALAPPLQPAPQPMSDPLEAGPICVGLARALMQPDDHLREDEPVDVRAD